MKMNDGLSGSAVFGFFKLYGVKVGLGMIGAALLYLVLPPVTNDGKFDQREFVARLAVAGFFSVMFGDWAIAILGNWQFLHAADNKAPIYLLVGAPGWWLSRAVALWFHKRRDKDIGEAAKDVKEIL